MSIALYLKLRCHGSSLDALMRELWRRHGQTGVGVPEDGLRQVAEQLAGRDLAAFFDAFVDGTDELPLAPLLATHGIAFEVRPAQGVKDRGGKRGNGEVPRVAIGATLGPDLSLQHVHAGGPAESAGLAAGDTLVALDRLKASAERLDAYARDAQPGDRIVVHAFRRDELVETMLTLSAPPDDTAFLALDAAATPEVVALRERWLG